MELGMMRVYCETYGCTANRGDSELMLGQLAVAGHGVAPSLSVADAVIVNTCAVKGTTYRKMLHRLRELHDTERLVIVAGCLPLIDLASIERVGKFAGIISCKSLSKLPEVMERILRGELDVRVIEPTFRDKPSMPKVRSSRVSAVVAICEGCTSNCSYCSVKFARGKLRSFDPKSILSEVMAAVDEHHREILLTAQDTAAYGLDAGTSLPELLNSVCSLGGEFKIRVGMMNPSSVKSILPELLGAYEDDKVYKFLHLPLQSGDDGILEAMRRRYTADEFLDIVEKFRERFHDLYLATDVIVGFPGEGEEEFLRTREIIERVKPDNVNLSRFSPLPRTEASKMPQVDGRDVARRSRALSTICRAIGYEKNKRYLGRTCEGLVTEGGKKGGFVARLPNYKPAILEGVELGEFTDLEIIGVRPTYLIGVRI